MKKLVLLVVLVSIAAWTATASAWQYPPVVVPFDSVVALAPLGYPPVLVAPIQQGPWYGSHYPGLSPYVDGYGLMPVAFLPRPLRFY